MLNESIKQNALGRIRISLIDRGLKNPRRNLDVDVLHELAESIKSHGVLSPVHVIKGTVGRYHLVAGFRRLAAARHVGLEEIPAIELEGDADAIAEVQLIENSQREDVHPMDEAEAIEELIQRAAKAGQVDPIDYVARRLGKSRAHVHRRMRLIRLPKDAREAFLEGELTHEHAMVIARVASADGRERAWKVWAKRGNWQKDMSASQFAERVETEVLLDLSEAGFDTSDVELFPDAGACGPCPKRTGNAQDLFGGVYSKGDAADLCTDSSCFKAKRDADWKRRSERAKEKGQEVIEGKAAAKIVGSFGHVESSSGYVGLDSTARFDARTGKSVTYKELLKGQDIKKVLARGPSGEVVEVYRKADADALIRKRAPQSGAEKKKREAEIKAEKAEKARRAREKLEAQVLEDLIPTIVAKAEALKPADYLPLLASLLFSGTDSIAAHVADRRELTLKQLGQERDPKVLQGMLLEGALPREWHLDERCDALRALAKHFKIDLAAAVKKAEAASAEQSPAAKAKKGGKR